MRKNLAGIRCASATRRPNRPVKAPRELLVPEFKSLARHFRLSEGLFLGL
jgi:hypothetical protein